MISYLAKESRVTDFNVERFHGVLHVFWEEGSPLSSDHEFLGFLDNQMQSVFDIARQSLGCAAGQGVER